MCYASPGPRCETHARERHAKLQDKTFASWNKMRAVEKEMFQIEVEGDIPDTDKASKGYQQLVKKRGVLFNKWKAHSDAATEAKREIDATRGGIKALRQEIMEHHNDGSSDAAMHRAHLMHRLEDGKKTFDHKMLDYDIKHGTVDGRDPSPHGDDTGVNKLRDKTRKLKDEYDNATHHVKRDAIYEKYQRANKALDHAVKTRDYAQRGLISPYRAALNTNYEKVQKYTAELKEIKAKRVESDKFYVGTVNKIQAVKRSEFEAGRKAESTYSPEAKREIRDLQAADREHNHSIRHPLRQAEKEIDNKLFTARNEWELGKKP